MKRALILVLVCILVLTLCPCTASLAADAPAGGFKLPKQLKTVAASVEGMDLPEGLPGNVVATDYTEDRGLITIQLNEKVPSLKVTEVDYTESMESTIFTKRNADHAETHRMSDSEMRSLNVTMTWKFDGGAVYTKQYNSLPGFLMFSGATLTIPTDPEEFKGWDAVDRRIAFREDGTLDNETWTLTNEKDSLIRTASYGEDGKLAKILVSWRGNDFDSYILDVETDAEGKLLSAQYRTRKTQFSVRGIPLSSSGDELTNFRFNSYAMDQFDTQLMVNYPVLAEQLFQITLPKPATMTDLSATMTDLPATMTDLQVVEDPGEATENTWIWELCMGNMFDAKVRLYLMDEPLLLIKGGKIQPNSKVKDINGTAVSFKGIDAKTAAFELPGVK